MAKIKLASYALYYNGKRIKRGLKTRQEIKNAALNYLMANPRLLKLHQDLLSNLIDDSFTQVRRISPFTITQAGTYTSDVLPSTDEDLYALFDVGKHLHFGKTEVQASGENLRLKAPNMAYRDSRYSPDAYENDDAVRLAISAERAKGLSLVQKGIKQDRIYVVQLNSLPNLKNAQGRSDMKKLHELQLYQVGDVREILASDYIKTVMMHFYDDLADEYEYFEVLEVINNGSNSKEVERDTNVLADSIMWGVGIHNMKQNDVLKLSKCTTEQYKSTTYMRALKDDTYKPAYAYLISQEVNNIGELVERLRTELNLSKRAARKVAYLGTKQR